MEISANDIEFFQENGAIVVRGLFSPAEMTLLEQGIEANMAEPSALSIVASRPEDPGYFIEDFCNWQRISQFREFVFNTRAAAVAGQLMKSRQVRLPPL